MPENRLATWPEPQTRLASLQCSPEPLAGGKRARCSLPRTPHPRIVERVQALAAISRSALCCHSNETRAPIANPPNSAQLEETPTIIPFPQVTSGSVQ